MRYTCDNNKASAIKLFHNIDLFYKYRAVIKPKDASYSYFKDLHILFLYSSFTQNRYLYSSQLINNLLILKKKLSQSNYFLAKPWKCRKNTAAKYSWAFIQYTCTKKMKMNV